MKPTPPSAGIGPALLFEFEIAERQLLALANAIPDDKYNWRPNPNARSVSEVLVHVAGGKFFLLDWAGRKVPEDFYGNIEEQGEQRVWAFVKRNDQFETIITRKDDVIALLTKSLHSVREGITNTDEITLTEPLRLRAYMRMIAHLHEHMGQIIAYTRAIGLPAPWPDWRKDRR